MTYYLIKLFLSAAVIVAVTEVSKRSSLVGGLLASLPLTSLLAMVWLYVDTRDAAKVRALSTSILWLVLPSLVLFLVLPLLLKRGVHFYASVGLAMLAMLGSYGAMLALLPRLGIKL
jgi:hypothetical protein